MRPSLFSCTGKAGLHPVRLTPLLNSSPVTTDPFFPLAYETFYVFFFDHFLVFIKIFRVQLRDIFEGVFPV